ncbi:MAG: carbohydrate kinase [Cyanobacteria bacterium]|jgi:sugar (pentulose or hexulose) kinase|nr:carbohydrate kinase [Cyanobacteria bacterium GSL.Bin21]
MFYLGIDFGTSGARAVVIDEQKTIQGQQDCSFVAGDNWVKQWREALFFLFEQLPVALREAMSRISVNGTSGTVLLCDRAGIPLTSPLLYNDRVPDSILPKLHQLAPADHVVQSSSSSLAKFLYWQEQGQMTPGQFFLHQADWLGFLLHGKLGISDYHNALKLGYDVENLCYPQWLTHLPNFESLPQVLAPGTPVATVTAAIAQKFGFPADCQVCMGTTDSIAAFIASGARTPGEAVTSLGSTLVLKLLSNTPVQATASGVYSHRFGDLWLTGGASNTGGAVLQQFFSDQQLKQLSAQIDPTQPTYLDYYPLVQPGERFPLNDPNLSPQLTPRPESDVKFLQGLLESMARIEAQGYQKLQALGASSLHRVYTAGGGAKNQVWQRIREQYLQVPVQPSPQMDAAYGTARLAQEGS